GLRHPAVQRRLATLEPGLDVVAGALALGAAAGGLAALAAGAATHTLGVAVRARCRLEVVDLDRHGGASSWVAALAPSRPAGRRRTLAALLLVLFNPHEVRDLGDHAADLGAVGELDGLVDPA